MTWRVHAPGQFYDAGESSVIYFDPHSGDTHLISDFAAHLVHELSEAPADTRSLVKRVSRQVETDAEAPEESTDLATAIESVLQELLSLDILVRD